MVAYNQTFAVSAPEANGNMGAVYIFNGTLRSWTQLQKLIASDASADSRFGKRMYLNKNRLVIAAEGADGISSELVGQNEYEWTPDPSKSKAGTVYVFERAHEGAHFSQVSKLYPSDSNSNSFFGENVVTRGDTAVVSSRNDDEPISDTAHPENTGAAYVFRQLAGAWSQQQRIIAKDFRLNDYENFYYQLEKRWDQPNFVGGPRTFSGNRKLTHTIDISDRYLALGARRTRTLPSNPSGGEEAADNNDVFVYQAGVDVGAGGALRWSLQQKLVARDTKETREIDVHLRDSRLVADLMTTTEWSSFVFLERPDSVGRLRWTQLQEISHRDGPTKRLNNAQMWGSTMLFHSDTTASAGQFDGGSDGEMVIYSQLHNESCLLFWMEDHFGDGWDTAVLSVRYELDGSNDTFHPHCDQVDPFFVRYCPYSIENAGIYTVKIFGATYSRFYWEMSYQVMVESTGKWYRGDFATKLKFKFDTTTRQFNFFEKENLVDLAAPCYRCQSIASNRWAEQVEPTFSLSLWPLRVYGAPYYISDNEGRLAYYRGLVCDNVEEYECYIRMVEGTYILRLGEGLFGNITEFPRLGTQVPAPNAGDPNRTVTVGQAWWKGCGRNGTYKDQFTFQIDGNGKCIPLAIDRFERPPHPQACGRSTHMPSPAPTMAPTEATISTGFTRRLGALDRESTGEAEEAEEAAAAEEEPDADGDTRVSLETFVF
jgi:hypothetical protein